jgi:tetratricopeptide (TPR) repeat protein
MTLLLWVALVWAEDGAHGVVQLPSSDAEIEISADASDAVQSGLDALEAHHWEEAARQFRALADAGTDVRLRWWEAIARYEGGELRAAERAAAQGLQVDAQHPGLLDLMGLVLTDLGRADEGKVLVERALSAARRLKDRGLEARALLHLGLGAADQGDYGIARSSWSACREVALAAGDTAMVGEVDAQLASLEGRGGDVVGQVSERLGRGDIAGAKALAASVSGADARSRARGGVVRAMVLRAEGRLDEAAAALIVALEAASATGLLREGVAARLELAHVLHLGAHPKEAAARLEEALALVSGTSFRVYDVDLHTARGRYALLDEQLDLAEAELADARAAAATVQDPHARLRIAELAGSVASARGDATGAQAALREAVAGWEKAAFYTEAARVACEGVRTAAAAKQSTDAWRAEAERLFASARDPQGPAHVRMSEGIGRAKASDFEGAVRQFADAARRARAVGAEGLASVADGNAGLALQRIQPADRALAVARELGIEGVLKTEGNYLDAKAAYEAGMKHFQAGRYPEARSAFESARTGFAAAGQPDMEKTARRSLAWARYNEVTTAEPAAALPVYEALVPEATALNDHDLQVRAQAAAAIAAGRLGRPDAVSRLRFAVTAAEQAGMKDLAGRCWAEIASQDIQLTERAEAARAALAWRPDQVGATAILTAAVAAWNAGDTALCQALLAEGRPFAGSLAGDYDALLRRSPGG